MGKVFYYATGVITGKAEYSKAHKSGDLPIYYMNAPSRTKVCTFKFCLNGFYLSYTKFLSLNEVGTFFVGEYL